MTRRSEGGQKRASYGPPRIRILSTKYWDDETGLYYYGYRYYSAELGRWLSRDPFEENGGYHLYAFVLNDPINSIDIYGLQQYIEGLWFREPYVENIDLGWQKDRSWYNSFDFQFGIQWKKKEVLPKVKFGYALLEARGDIGFTVHCIDECSKREWYVSKKWRDIRKDIRVPIGIKVGPKVAKRALLGIAIYQAERDLLEYYSSVQIILQMTPTQICEKFPNG